MPLARFALYESGVEIYVASTADDGDAWQATLVHIARESRAYVVAPCAFQRASSYPGRLPAARRAGRRGVARPRRQRDPRARRLVSRRAGVRRGGRSCTPSSIRPAARGAAALRPGRPLQPAGRARASPIAGTMRRRVDVLPCDQPVAEREDVDAVPLQRAGRSPSIRTRRSRRRRGGCRVAKRRSGLLRKIAAMCSRTASAPSARSSAVWFWKTIAGACIDADRVDVLRVPRVVVALDQLVDVHRRRRSTLASPTRRVTPSASKRSRRAAPSCGRRRARRGTARA